MPEALAIGESSTRTAQRQYRRPPPPTPYPPPPPPPPGRLSFGLASFTVNDRPSAICPFIPAIAAWASWSEPISTNPNPFDRPVSRSWMACAVWTAPSAPTISRSWSSVTPYPRLPTYNFFPTVSHLTGPNGPEADG